MPAKNTVEFLEQLVSDEAFRARFENDRATILAESELDTEQRSALERLDVSMLVNSIQTDGMMGLVKLGIGAPSPFGGPDVAQADAGAATAPGNAGPRFGIAGPQ